MSKADVVEGCRRLKARNVAAELGGFLVGAQNDRDRIPANGRAYAMLDGAVPFRALFSFRRDGVDIGRVDRERRMHSDALRFIGELFEQKCRAIASSMMQNGAQRIDPFAGFQGVSVGAHIHFFLPQFLPDLSITIAHAMVHANWPTPPIASEWPD